jgi:hypothetical protein
VLKISHNKDGYAAQALSCLSPLYQIEAYAKEQGFSPRLRKRLRQKKAWPLLNAFHTWLKKTGQTALPKSTFCEAINYTLNRWSEIIRYMRHGEVEINGTKISFSHFLCNLLLTWLGAGGESLGLDRYLKANTVKKRIVSLLRNVIA